MFMSYLLGILKNSTGTELSLCIGGLGQGPNSQGNWQIRWYYLFGQILQVRWKKKTILRFSNSSYQHLLDSFKVVLSNIKMKAVCLRSSMRMNAQSKKNSWRLCLIKWSQPYVSKLKELRICNQNCVYIFFLPQDKTEPTS